MIAPLLLALSLVAHDDPTAGDGLPGAIMGPSREDVIGLIRKVGRDEPSEALVDQILAQFRPRCLMLSRSLETTALRVAAPAFVKQADAISRKLAGRPADARMMIERAVLFQQGYSPSNEPEIWVDYFKRLAEPPMTLTGRLVDGAGKPVAGASVSSYDGLTTTDDRGEFSLSFHQSRQGWATVYFEATGFALADTNFDHDALSEAQGRTYTLRPQAACDGMVVDAETGAPIAGAEVALWVHGAAFDPDHSSIDPTGQRVNRYLTLVAKSDDRGRYAFRGLPHRGDAANYAVTIRAEHPRYQTIQDQFNDDQSPRPGITIPMKPGAVIAGFVTDPGGVRIPFAGVRVFHGENRGEVESVQADARGEFSLGNLQEGDVRVAAEAEGFAMTIVPAAAALGDPVWMKVRVEEGQAIRGTLIGPDGEPAAGARVGPAYPLNEMGEIDNIRPIASSSAITGEDGTFRLGPLTPGRYRIYARITEPGPYSLFVDVATGETHYIIGKGSK